MAERAKPVKELFREISLDKKEAFDQLFLDFYDRLVAFAKQYVKHRESAEEITSELFVRLWLRRNKLADISRPDVYLYISIKNACLNHLRQTNRQHALYLEETVPATLNIISSHDPAAQLEHKELQAKLDAAVNTLPEQRRLIFRMVKEDGLKCREVAEILDLSVRTVESQVYKAVKTLADILSPYLGGVSTKKEKSIKIKLLSLSVFF